MRDNSGADRSGVMRAKRAVGEGRPWQAYQELVDAGAGGSGSAAATELQELVDEPGPAAGRVHCFPACAPPPAGERC